MSDRGLKALIATSPANVFYTSDCWTYGISFAVLPLERNIEPVLITSVSGTCPITLMAPPWFNDVRYYGEFYIETRFAEEPLSKEEHALIHAQESWEYAPISDPIALLLSILKEKDLTKGKIGIEQSILLSSQSYLSEMKAFPDLEAIPAQDIYREIRMVKTSEEVDRIHKAIIITEKAWKKALEEVNVGTTEIEFSNIWQHTIIEEGGLSKSYLGAYWPPIAFGRRTAFSDIAQPSNYKIQEGDIIRFDGGATYQGYPSDMARSAVFRAPSKKVKMYWRALWEGEQKAIEMAKLGALSSEIFHETVNTVRKRGIKHYKRHHTGHGWGIEGYDPPTISPKNKSRLEEKMVLCFETPYYEVGWGGLLHEDVIVVKKEGAKYLSTPEDELRIIG
jgi:Xaa-Pro aminopeptidase